MQPLPRILRDVGGVAGSFRLQAGVAHRAEIKLHEAEQQTAGFVLEFDQGVGSNRPLPARHPE
jgi:hypothetical protein